MAKYKYIFNAIEANDVEAVKAFLPEQLEAKDKFGRTPLIRACSLGRAEIASLLLDRGADIEAKDDSGWTALHCICIRCKSYLIGNDDLSEYLVKRGADPIAKNREGFTSLDLDTKTVKDKYGNDIQHSQILLQLRAEYLNKHTLDTSERNAALSSGWEMEM